MQNFFKKNVDLALNRFGYNISKLREKPPSNAFNVLRLVLDDFIAHDSHFFFIQVGANDGVRWDPLRDFILLNNIPGILIEPLPDMFDQLKFNYSSQKNLIFEHAAISDCDGNRPIYRAHANAPVEDWVHGIASFNKEHVLSSIPHEYLESVSIRTITPDSLLQKHGVKNFELLQVDTEGYDYKILELFLEKQRLVPKIINYENVNLSESEKLNAKKLLLRHGYKFLDVSIDTIALHETYPNNIILEQK